MANNQTKSYRAAVKKAKKVHEGNIIAVITGYKGKVPQTKDEFREHGPYAFKPDPEAIKRRQERRRKATAPRNKSFNPSVTSFIG